MDNKKFQCSTCGAIILGEAARREHCQIHHPGTPFARLDIYFPLEYREIKDDAPAPTFVKPTPKTTKKKVDKQGNVSYVVKQQTSKNVSDFDCAKAIPINVPICPKSSNPEDLFEYAVKHAASKFKESPSLLAPRTAAQWGNICFDAFSVAAERLEYMQNIKETFRPYFKGSGYKYAFDFEQIVRDFPHYFEGGENFVPTQDVNLDKLISAIQTEIYLSQQPNNRLKYKVKKIENIDPVKRLYLLHLDLGDSDMPSFYEGIAIKLCVGDKLYDCEGIDYSITEEILTVKAQRTIFGNSGKIYIDTIFILKSLNDKLRELQVKGFAPSQPGRKIIPDTTHDVSVISELPESNLPIVKKMDQLQQNAHNFAIQQDITFIWGPPGTGKSFTLAGLINTFFHHNSKTLVCCISNVAVDQLLNKVIDVVESMRLHPLPGQLLRSGHTIDSRLMRKDFLFPSDSETRRIREQITDLTKKIASRCYDTKEKTLFKERRIELRETLKQRVETLIGRSTIVFSTIANYVLSQSLAEKEFDNLIVDEASMLSLPYLMAIAGKISKRIILVGDPNQLGPIAINPDRILHESIFDYCNITNSESPHPALRRLLTQRRSHPAIVDLTNQAFYDGTLRPCTIKSPVWVHDGPMGKMVIRLINEHPNTVKPYGTSRRNFETCDIVMELLEDFYRYCHQNHLSITIGIITPYRAQVRMYYARVKDAYGNTDFYQNIMIGTIHTFQGAECDVIFFDLVEEASLPIGKLFKGKDGERLITVALTRARHKLIVVGDTRRFENPAGLVGVSPKVRDVLKSIRDKDYPQESTICWRTKKKKKKKTSE